MNIILREKLDLKRKGYVNDEYENALKKREKEYPTGLDIGSDINVAIPHVDSKYVKKAAISVGILKNPVEFYKMEEPTEKVKVQIIIMLALSEPHGHIEMLGRIIEMIKNKKLLEELIIEKDKKEIFRKISDNLL